MKTFFKTFFLVVTISFYLMSNLWASTKYIILKDSLPCLSKTCISTTSTDEIIDNNIHSFNIQKKSLKNFTSNSNTLNIFNININQKKIEVSILDSLGSDDVYPLYKIKSDFDKYPLYAVYATGGSSGRYFHYFSFKNNDLIYLGLFPELNYDSQTKMFQTIEKDGPRKILTMWSLENYKLSKTNEEIFQ